MNLEKIRFGDFGRDFERLIVESDNGWDNVGSAWNLYQ